jgi:putative NADH-flavin reductase
MKIAVLGASGRSGKAIVEVALSRGHTVRVGPRGPIASTLDRHDLATFLVDVAEDKTGTHRRRAPFVSW